MPLSSHLLNTFFWFSLGLNCAPIVFVPFHQVRQKQIVVFKSFSFILIHLHKAINLCKNTLSSQNLLQIQAYQGTNIN